MLALSPAGELLWSTPASLPTAGRLIQSLEVIDDAGAVWVTGWGFDEGIIVDKMGWVWLGRIDGAGAWTWLEDTPHAAIPVDTSVREDGSAVVLIQSSSGPNTLYSFFDFAYTADLVYDPSTDTLAALVIERSDESSHFGWVRLDALGETVLSWRSIGPGRPTALEPDGLGGAYVLSDHGALGLQLGHYGPDSDAPASWSVGNDHAPVDLAVDHPAGRAYVLTKTGIDVFMTSPADP